MAGSSSRGRVGRCASARSTGARLGGLTEITTQPLLEMLAENTPQRHLTATLGPPEGDGNGPIETRSFAELSVSESSMHVVIDLVSLDCHE
jgi:hypothetical protein